MCTVLLPPVVNPIAVNNHIIIIICVMHLELCFLLAAVFVRYCVLVCDLST
jgi:hypothetical protein